MILIHTALQCEAQCIIEKYKLQKTNSNPKIYSNEKFLVLIGGVGKENTIKNLSYIFDHYTIAKAINLGIAGCSDLNTPIGAVYSCYSQHEGITYKELITVNTAQTTNDFNNFLYDMEGNYFIEIVKQFLDDKDIDIFKIVSDHLDDKIKDKDTIKSLISKQLSKISYTL